MKQVILLSKKKITHYFLLFFFNLQTVILFEKYIMSILLESNILYKPGGE